MKCLRPNFEQRGGLICVTTPDSSDDLLLVSVTDESAWRMTMRTAEPYYRSRSNGMIWRPAIFGRVQLIRRVLVNRSGDWLLYLPTPDRAGTNFPWSWLNPLAWRDVLVPDGVAAATVPEGWPLELVDVAVCDQLRCGWGRREDC